MVEQDSIDRYTSGNWVNESIAQPAHESVCEFHEAQPAQTERMLAFS